MKKDKDMQGAMLKKALGYTVTEKVVEYIIDENGNKKPTKEKRQTKYYPPDPSALKSYIELSGKECDIENMTDEELEKEKNRLMALLAEQA